LDEESRKKTEEEWRSQVDKDKKEAEAKNTAYRQPTLAIFLSSLSMQTMIALGKLENPLAGKTEVNYDQARFLINTLEIIKEKTINNLNSQEKALLDDYLFNLRTIYVEAKKPL